MVRIRIIAVAALFCALWAWGCETGGKGVVKPETPVKPETEAPTGRALSMRQLGTLLQAGETRPEIPAEVLHLAGTSILTGFIIDRRNHDVILVGRAEKNRPPLHVEDLIIALRAVYMRYAEVKDGVYKYFNPSCSIDPAAEDFKALQNGSPEDWAEICGRPQVVVVRGAPFDSRFAKVMVDADYDMKTLVNGTSSLNTVKLKSLPRIRLDQDEKDILAGRPVSEGFTINRFWFYPGETSYVRGSGEGLLIRNCSTILLTEKEYISRKGRFSGMGADPQADLFARQFTELLPRIAQERPIYLELENLFRFIALAKAMEHEKVFKKAGLDASYLLDDYRLQATSVRRTVPGLYAENRLEVGTRSSLISSCGGVSISLDLDEKSIHRDESGQAARTMNSALKARPSPKALAWSFSD